MPKICNTCHIPKEDRDFRKCRKRCKSCNSSIESKRIHNKCKANSAYVAKRTKWHKNFVDSIDGIASTRLSIVRGRATRKNLAFDLDAEWMKSKLNKGLCELTGIPFSSNPNFIASVDRINPKLGYVKTNCRMVLYCVNAFKGTLSDHECIEIAKALVRHAS